MVMRYLSIIPADAVNAEVKGGSAANEGGAEVPHSKGLAERGHALIHRASVAATKVFCRCRLLII